MTYYWDNDFSFTGDSYTIRSMILGADRTWDQQFNINFMLQGLNESVFEALSKKCKGNAALLIALFMEHYDSTFQQQINIFANTTNRLSAYTNNYIDAMSSFFSRAGSFTNSDTNDAIKSFTNFMRATDVFSSQHVSNPGFFQNYVSNTFNVISSLQIDTFLEPGTVVEGSLSDVFFNVLTGFYPPEALIAALNSLNPPPSSSVDPSGKTPPVAPAQPNPEFQTLINAITAGGSLITQQSKSVGTLATSLTNTDSQLLKIMAGTVDSTGSGLVALTQFIVQKFIAS
jgi:hypothetical protein